MSKWLHFSRENSYSDFCMENCFEEQNLKDEFSALVLGFLELSNLIRF